MIFYILSNFFITVLYTSFYLKNDISNFPKDTLAWSPSQPNLEVSGGLGNHSDSHPAGINMFADDPVHACA
jgi:hypothetical protein